jgi:hypothetical protein
MECAWMVLAVRATVVRRKGSFMVGGGKVGGG